MPYLKFLLTFLVFTCMRFALPAQKAKYADVQTGYNARIAGTPDNKLHVWSGSVEYVWLGTRNITLILQVFSSDMRLINEKKIVLGEIRSWNIDFRYEDSFYYANIVCISNTNKRLHLKVSADGNYTDVSDTPFIPAAPVSTNESNWFTSTIWKNNCLFIADISNAKRNNADTILTVRGDSILPGDNYQKILVRKVNAITRQTTFVIIGSSNKKFYHPVITVTDSAVLVSALSERLQGIGAKNNAFVLLARLDTNITATGTNDLSVLPAHAIRNEIYSPLRVFEINNKVLVVSKGLYNKETVSYSTENAGGVNIPAPRLTSRYITTSLKLTLIDEKNNWIKDTILESRGNNKNLLPDELFMVESGNGIDFFISKKYGATKKGIAHFSLDVFGRIKEEDMILDIRYDYQVQGAKIISPGVIVIPFSHNWRRGLVKLEYEPVSRADIQ